MTKTRGERPWILAALAYPVLGFLGSIAAGPAPGFIAKPGDVAAYFQTHGSGALASSVLFLLSSVVVLGFAAAMRPILRPAEGEDGRLGGIAHAGGVAGATLSLAASAVLAVPALRVQNLGSIDAPMAAVLNDLALVLYGTAAAAAFGAFVLGTAIVGLRTGCLPRWLGAISIPLGVALLIPPVANFATTPFSFWVGVTSIVIAVRKPAGASVGAPSYAAS